MNINSENLGEFLIGPLFRAMLVLAPLLGLILIVSPLLSMAQTGFNIAQDKLTPDLSRLNPLSGLRRMFSMHQWIEGAKSCVKILLFSWLAWSALRKYLPSIAIAGEMELRSQIQLMLDVTLSIGVRIAIMMAMLAIGDFGYQWWEFQKKLRMTQQEMKDEMKEREGNPMIKQRQRSIAMQRLRQRMMSEVPKANVIVTNPTHFAVALTYNRGKAPAPYVCAKGTQFMAQRIKEVALAHGIPIIENKPLARALYKQVKVGQIIPSEFYKAVAEVLAFVFMLKNRKQQRQSPVSRYF
jgi:flagellar biosynthesis protein FlhB